MNQFVEMDIFFFITTLVVILIGVLLVVILLRIWRILGHVEDISRDVSEESSLIRGDIAHLRVKIKTEGFKLVHFHTLFTSALARFKRKRRRVPKDEEEA
jgi:hypothetical protein